MKGQESMAVHRTSRRGEEVLVGKYGERETLALEDRYLVEITSEMRTNSGYGSSKAQFAVTKRVAPASSSELSLHRCKNRN